jgi:phage terminase large subunit-like protein
MLRMELTKISARVELQEHRQGFQSMAPALDYLEGELLSGRIRHGGNPVLTWCAANAIAVMDPAGNRKLDKAKSHGRIDGMVALAMALSPLKSDVLPKRASIYAEGTV